jgi:hypothetical protein
VQLVNYGGGKQLYMFIKGLIMRAGLLYGRNINRNTGLSLAEENVGSELNSLAEIR